MRGAPDSPCLIVSLLTKKSLCDFGAKYESYCKDIGSIPVQNPLNPYVRCFIIKTQPILCGSQRLKDRAEERDGTGWSRS